MGFIGVYKASYDYTPQGEGELEISEGDILYVLEKSTEDDWWKAKKKATTENDDEPTGLIPCNYIEEVCSKAHPSTFEGRRGAQAHHTSCCFPQFSMYCDVHC